MDLTDKRLLVIGGGGLIGSHTVDALLREPVAEIRVFDNFTRGSRDNLADALRDPRVDVFPYGGDILHRDVLHKAMQDIDGVFHFAALWLLHCQEFPRSAFDVNIGGTFNVLEACINNGIKRLVYSSSASVYGDAVEEPMTESHPYNNTNFYGATKIAGEHMARALYHRHKATTNRFDYVGLRYMNVYGPRQDYQGAYISVIMKILDRIDAGEPPIVYGDGSQAYDFVYVGDCAAANVRAMQAEATDEFYNVGTGIRTTLKELTQLVLEVSHSQLPIHYEPAGTTFVKNRVGSTVKAEQQLGFKASVGLREGVRQLIRWRQAHRDQVIRKRQQMERRAA
jgi:UDP-glucose 4-epimerase